MQMQQQKVGKEKRCRVCPELLFKTEEEYLLHIRDVHKGKFVDCYMCNVCGKTFKTGSALTQHINSKCGTEKQFTCKVCGQKLMTAGSLYNHMRRHSGQANFMCRFCAKLFLTAGQLKVHERIHTQQKDFVCNVCDKGFCHRQSLITHSSVHTGIKPYQCEGCEKSFSCVGNLLKHRKTHADSCGLLPLTTHRVQNPSTKIKVRINTPASSKLKKLKKNRELEEKIAMLEVKLAKNTNAESGATKQEIEKNCLQTENMKMETRSSEKQNNNLNKWNGEMSNDCTTSNIFDKIIDNPVISENVETDIQKIMTNEDCRKDYDSKEETDDLKYVADPSIKKPTDKRTGKRKKDPLFDTKVEAFIKERKLENSKRASCKYCNKEYTQFRWLYKHEHDHEKSDVNVGEVQSGHFKCSCCKLYFGTKEDVKQHQQLEHSDILTLQSPLWDFLQSGIEENKMNELFAKYPVNEETFLPQEMDTDLRNSVPGVVEKQDSVLYQLQNQAAHGLSALDKIFNGFIKGDTNNIADVKEEILDSMKIFSDLHHKISVHRRNIIVPFMDARLDT